MLEFPSRANGEHGILPIHDHPCLLMDRQDKQLKKLIRIRLGLLRTGATPKTMKDGLGHSQIAHRASSVDRNGNLTMPDIDGDGPMP
jgi:hypothetical protein